jgi:hypothetical protein
LKIIEGVEEDEDDLFVVGLGLAVVVAARLAEEEEPFKQKFVSCASFFKNL